MKKRIEKSEEGFLEKIKPRKNNLIYWIIGIVILIAILYIIASSIKISVKDKVTGEVKKESLIGELFNYRGGRCKNIPGCNSEGQKICSGTSKYKICGDYNSDGCFEPGSREYNCPNGCLNGNCITPRACRDQGGCSARVSRVCDETRIGYRVCGDYNKDGCYEPHPTNRQACQNGYYCLNGNCVKGR